MLRVIQLNTLEDRTIGDKRDWDQAVKFLEASVKEKIKESEETLKALLGPSVKERWLYWKYQSEVQSKRQHVKNELDRILYSNDVSRVPSHSQNYTFRKFNLLLNNSIEFFCKLL